MNNLYLRKSSDEQRRIKVDRTVIENRDCLIQQMS